MSKVYIVNLMGADGESELGRFADIKAAKAYAQRRNAEWGKAAMSLRIEDGIPPSWLETTSVE